MLDKRKDEIVYVRGRYSVSRIFISGSQWDE